MKKRWIIFSILAVIALGAGLAAGLKVDQKKAPENGHAVPIELKEILLGSMVQDKRNGVVFAQRSIVNTEEPLAFKLSLGNITEAGVLLGVRLLQGDGSLYPLTPDSVTIKEKESTQCCWYIDKPGKYQFQLILPGKAPVVAPIQVKQATSSGSSSISF